MNDPMKFYDVLGWIGAAFIVGAYAAATTGALPADAMLSLVLNVLGSIGIVVSSVPRGAYQAGAVNAVWGVIGLVGIARAFF